MKIKFLRKNYLFFFVVVASCIAGCGSKDDFSGSGELSKAKDGNSPALSAPNGAKAHAPLMVPDQKHP